MPNINSKSQFAKIKNKWAGAEELTINNLFKIDNRIFLI